MTRPVAVEATVEAQNNQQPVIARNSAPRHPLDGPRLHRPLSRCSALLYSVSLLWNRYSSTRLCQNGHCRRYLLHPNKSVTVQDVTTYNDMTPKQKDRFWKEASPKRRAQWKEWARENLAAIKWNQERADSRDDESVQKYAPDYYERENPHKTFTDNIKAFLLKNSGVHKSGI
eukprot:g27346.t1